MSQPQKVKPAAVDIAILELEEVPAWKPWAKF